MAKRKRTVGFARIMASIGQAATQNAVKALAEGAQLITEDAKSRIHSVSGDLAASVRAIPRNKGTVIKIVADATDKKGVPYGQYVEFWPGREHPFMYPAMYANRSTVKKMVADAIREAVRNHAAK